MDFARECPIFICLYLIIKENVFCPAFFWIIVILTGLSYWKNKKIYWILTQVLVFMVFFRAMFPFYAIFIELNPVVFYILPLLYSTVFFVVERKLFKINQLDGFRDDFLI